MFLNGFDTLLQSMCSAAGNAIRITMTLSRDNCYRALRATATEHGYID